MKMKNKLISLLFICGLTAVTHHATAQDGVGIGVTVPDSSAALHIQPPSNNKGLLIPRVNKDVIGSPAEGLLVYDTAKNNFYFFNQDSEWESVGTPPGGIIMKQLIYQKDKPLKQIGFKRKDQR